MKIHIRAGLAFASGSLVYHGFEVEGIVGLDFLLQTGATIDLARLEIRKEAQA